MSLEQINKKQAAEKLQRLVNNNFSNDYRISISYTGERSRQKEVTEAEMLTQDHA